MKRLATFVLAMIMVLSLVACGTTTKAPETQPAATAVAAAESVDTPAVTEEYPYICVCVRSLSNPQHQLLIKGGEVYAEKKGIPADHVLQIIHDNDSQTLLNDMEAYINKYDGNIVFFVDPAQKADLLSIADMCEEAGVYWSSQWSIPDAGMTISDYPHWVSAINFGDVEAGYIAGVALFEAMGGEGDVWICDGTAGHSSTVDRNAGFSQALAEYPNVKVIGSEDCGWEKTKAYNSVASAIVANPSIKGIYGCNDNMACGAIEALAAKGLDGTILVAGANAIPDMVQYIIDGKATASVSTNPLWASGISLAQCVDAYQGKYDPSSVEDSMRYWVAKSILVTAENAQSYKDNYLNGAPEFDYSDYYADNYIEAGKYY